MWWCDADAPDSGDDRRVSLRIAIALFDDVEELDWAGPWEVLASWAGLWPDDAVEVFTVADSLTPVRCANGIRVLPDQTWDDVGPVDLVVYPGGLGTFGQLGDETIRARMRHLSATTSVMASVCTGSLVFADAGLLDGLPATTHWGAIDQLATMGSGIDIRPDDRFVDAGHVVTSSGVSAGIDMALHLVARFHSTERAREVRRVIQYDPSPPV
jgi:transcriptional regulator GlxA family with amidase domain